MPDSVDSGPLERVVGDLATFGRKIRAWDDTVIRCASVDAAVVERIVDDLHREGLDIGPDVGEYRAQLNWAGTAGSVVFWADVLLPDDPPACPADIT